jgi:glutamine---fructose-6-phosphate transaminase (isomerizing)
LLNFSRNTSSKADDEINLFFKIIIVEDIIMCGIYASSSSNAGQKVFEGLKRMEYRGYDSWGVATLSENREESSGGTAHQIKVKKRVGKLSNLKDIKFPKVSLSLGHTRWATHGGVTKVNAHPHLAANKSFALVQNGVVENYQELKRRLLEDTYNFVSETDTEVIVGLLEKEMKIKNEETLLVETFIKVFKKLAGRNTVVTIGIDGKIMAIKNGSPLVVGRSRDGEIYFSSDVLSMSLDVSEYFILQSGQMVIFDSVNNKLSVTNIESGKKLKIKFVPLDHKVERVDKNGFDSFMLKEIHEQAHVLSNVVRNSEKKFSTAIKMLKGAKKVFTLGSGSASFATGNTAYLLRKIGIFASAIEAYEADSYFNFFDSKNSVCIVFSQSGETADTNEVVELMKEKGVKIISVVNMPGSTLTQISDLSFMLGVGPELAVASTKAFFGHALWGMTIHDMISGFKFGDLKAKIDRFEYRLEEWFSDNIVQNKIRRIAKSLVQKEHLFVLGRGDLYYAGLESALKLKEISYIHAEGFSGGELKHGVIALIEKNTPVLCLVNEDENKANMMSAIAEVNARGGRVIAVAKENNELYGDWIQLPDTNDYIFLSSVIPSQLITCYIAMEKGYDVDKPRNLAKSVTVK